MPPNTADLPVDEKAAKLTKYWLDEISDAMKREKKYRQIANEVVNIYEAKKPDQVPFNILYSNTETLVPAIYNARPIPIVQRKYKDADPLGKAVAEVSTRILKFLIDHDDKNYDNYDEVTQSAVLDAAVTNRGTARFRYMDREGMVPECAYGEAVRWDKFLHGYARTWKKVPWIGFEWDMSADELRKNFPDALIDYNRFSSPEDDPAEKAEDRDELTGVKAFKVYEIWDKKSSKVMFFSHCCRAPLKIVDDPLKLSTFFPTPRPLNFMKKITTLIPTPLYQQYRQQVQELNELTRRLKAVIKACKYRGAYNSTVEGIEKMLEANDNELVPVENIQSMPDGAQGMDKLLYIVPVNELVQSAQILYQQREQCKQVIYEITGISDILRGASVASETATAQNIKNQWGTLRLKKMQKEVQRYCRETMEILLEIAAANFEIDTIRQMTGLPYLTEAEKAQIGQTIQMAKMQYDAQAAQAQLAGQQPPPQPDIPPEIQQALAAPTWEQIMSVMRNDVLLHYKVDIETNSTIDAEAAQDKQDIAELLNAVSQFLNGVAPLVETGVLPMEVAKNMLLVVSRRFNFGSQLEDALNAMQPPKPQSDPAAEAKTQAAQAQAALDKQKAEQEMRKMALDAQLEQMEFNNKKTLMLLQADLDRQKLEIQREELRIQQQGLAAKAAFQSEQQRIKLAGLRSQTKEDSSASV